MVLSLRCGLITISSLWVLLKSSQSASHPGTHATSPSGYHHCPLLEQWGATVIKVLCPIQDWRKSNEFRECLQESNKNGLDRPSAERLRELGLFQLQLLVGGIINFQETKEYLAKLCGCCGLLHSEQQRRNFDDCPVATISSLPHPLCNWDCSSPLLSDKSLLH